MAHPTNRVVIGTRQSRLARVQTELVRELLHRAHPALEIEVRDFVTTGDRFLDRPIHEIGTKGLFTRELDQALLDGEIDLAVHSLKDLPAEMPAGIELGSVPERVSPQDCLVAKKPLTLNGLPPGSRLGTSSLRRQSQLRVARPDLSFVDIRGNLDTRWRKHEEGQYDALVLALAGAVRLGWKDRVRHVLEPSVCLPAPCQGTLGITVRTGDGRVKQVVEAIEDPAARTRAECERGFLEELGGGCTLPAAALARFEGESRLHLQAFLADPEGKESLSLEESGEAADARALGTRVARKLLESGGDRWIPDPSGGGG